MSRWLSTLTAILGVAAAYYVSGRLGLLLAIPPGYATAVWPASGVALAAVILLGVRVLPGVWLGSFMINIWTSLDTSNTAGLIHSLPLPAFIGFGAMLQAWLGAWLIQRLIGYQNLLAQEMDAVRMLLLGGPLSCVIAASMGVGSLWYMGLVPDDAVLFNWWTWWVGDSIGVLVFTPLILVWTVRPFATWLTRQLAATLPLIMLFILVVWLFFFASAREQARIENEFNGWTEEFSEPLQQRISDVGALLYDSVSYFESSSHVEQAEFLHFARRSVQRFPEAFSMAFDRRVLGSERAAFEQLRRAQGQPDFSIREPDASGKLLPAPQRDWYMVVDAIVSAAEVIAVEGLNVGFDPVRRTALQHAGSTGKLTATAPLVLLQDREKRPGVLLFMPVYANGKPVETTQQREQNLYGHIVIGLRIADLLQKSLRRVRQHGVDIWLYDDAAPAAQSLIYQTSDHPPLTNSKEVMGQTIRFDMYGRPWRVELQVPTKLLVANRTWQTWTLLAAGMLFTGLLGVFLLVVIGRQSKVEELVDQATAQLQRTNSELGREAARSEKLEVEAQRRARELSSSNRELEQFAYAASHDLQGPLRNITSFAQLLERRYNDKLDDEAREFIGFIRQGVNNMHTLINDILRLSRINPSRSEMAQISAQDVVAQACRQIASDIAACNAKIEYEGLPEIFGDAGMLTQLFQNLISNAIKFQPAGRQPEVRIEASLQGNEWRFCVRDNGIGIKPEAQEQIFVMFKRLHTAEQYPGTGIGLTICRKIVQLHGGQIWVESTPGEGTRFLFTLALQAQEPAPAGR